MGDKLGRFGNIFIADIDGDGIKDILIGAERADNNSRTDSGSLYYINGKLFNSLTGAGNTVDLANLANYTIRFDGAIAGDLLGKPAFVADINHNSKPDIITRAGLTGNNSRTDSGSLYVIYDSFDSLMVRKPCPR